MAISAFDHPFLSGLLGDEETGAFFSAAADIKAMLAFERALALAEGQAGLIPLDAGRRIADHIARFWPDMDGLREGVSRDGVVVAELVRQLRNAVGGEDAAHVHVGATSQDVIDTSLMLRLSSALSLHMARLDALVAGFRALDDAHGGRRLMGHTRMQAAIPITVSDRIRAWVEPLEHHAAQVRSLANAGLPLQFGGAAGTLDRLQDKAAEVRGLLAAELGLADVAQWHSQRDRLVEIAGLFSRICGSLGKFGQDVALLAQMGGEIGLSGGGGSSAMAHKQNPVAAEALVALARFNAVQVSGLHHALVHEQERSGAAWTLEWLLLPSMALASGASLRLALDLIGKIRSLGTA
ncbi:3-carboxy-cis,cis-muconate cycloisomerase [Rhizobium sp. CSW-27]|uniref:3-carboxy-cis,cis-muconate cycloisomerase n=1 Tax=Rhizobium sp. CSW-27 TaxID=2839985 RepID=UPI001C0373B1|nr:3-carboxy-cis,cis-muconate cycloisomerase [Rhizobium sp. CSW-27]MBT9369792.1 3-carboxy-cis,cis-muconate cycloisomerase [Rhizobium sp. CSW-27]